MTKTFMTNADRGVSRVRKTSKAQDVQIKKLKNEYKNLKKQVRNLDKKLKRLSKS